MNIMPSEEPIITIASTAARDQYLLTIFPKTFLSSWWLILLMIDLLFGSPTSSEWDQQWNRLQEARNQENLQEAKDILHNMLPFVRSYGPSDEQYGQVIFHPEHLGMANS